MGIEPLENRLNFTASDNLAVEGGIPLTNAVENSSPDGPRGVEDNILIADDSVHVWDSVVAYPKIQGNLRSN